MARCPGRPEWVRRGGGQGLREARSWTCSTGVISTAWVKTHLRTERALRLWWRSRFGKAVWCSVPAQMVVGNHCPWRKGELVEKPGTCPGRSEMPQRWRSHDLVVNQRSPRPRAAFLCAPAFPVCARHPGSLTPCVSLLSCLLTCWYVFFAWTSDILKCPPQWQLNPVVFYLKDLELIYSRVK